jgi:hypothetical protein
MTYKTLKITFNNTETKQTKNVFWDIRQFSLAQKWAAALEADYLNTGAVLEKQFMLHGWVYPTSSNRRTIQFMCDELNFHIDQVNNYALENDIDYYIDMFFTEETLDQEQLNKIHHHFEILIGQTWNMSEWYEQFDAAHQFSINNFNWLCHEIESQLRGLDAYNNNRSSSSLVFCMKPIKRHELVEADGDYDNFEMRDLEFGQIRMHYAQTGKTHREAWHDNDEDIYDDNISGIRYLSGEFDIHLNTKSTGEDWNAFQTWCMEKQIDVNDKTLSLGQCCFGDLNKSLSGFADNNLGTMQELWQYDDIQTITLYNENGLSSSFSWGYNWNEQYAERKRIFFG